VLRGPIDGERRAVRPRLLESTPCLDPTRGRSRIVVCARDFASLLVMPSALLLAASSRTPLRSSPSRPRCEERQGRRTHSSQNLLDSGTHRAQRLSQDLLLHVALRFGSDEMLKRMSSCALALPARHLWSAGCCCDCLLVLIS
jgi:hypothetical protein